MVESIIKLLNYSQDGDSPITPVLKDKSIWLTEAQMMQLYGKSSSTINEHIKNIYEEGELKSQSTSEKITSSGKTGKTGRPPTYYNLDMILAVGYRAKSKQGIAFRNWATTILKEFATKGFVFNDTHLQQADKLEAVLDRIREIRFSESNLYSKIKDLIAYSSYDYEDMKQTDNAKRFFAILQNKFLFAITGLTAREIVMERLDHNKPAGGLQTVVGKNKPLAPKEYAGLHHIQLIYKNKTTLDDVLTHIGAYEAKDNGYRFTDPTGNNIVAMVDESSRDSLL